MTNACNYAFLFFFFFFCYDQLGRRGKDYITQSHLRTTIRWESQSSLSFSSAIQSRQSRERENSFFFNKYYWTSPRHRREMRFAILFPIHSQILSIIQTSQKERNRAIKRESICNNEHPSIRSWLSFFFPPHSHT